MSGKTFLSFCLLILSMIFFVGNGAGSCDSAQMAFSGDYSGAGVTYEEEGVDPQAMPSLTITEDGEGVGGVIAGFTFPYEEHLPPLRGTIDGAEVVLEGTEASSEDVQTTYRLSLQGYGSDDDGDLVVDHIDFDGTLTTYVNGTSIDEIRFHFSVDRQ
ncbi:MAG: hypothetical protein D6795_06810 [Deltaproteobacteria bacterium]|nr:MAG: hypothetical protein D6795_06810 [Deltaproteobacteria bacterium]